jgi:hypothetical protein
MTSQKLDCHVCVDQIKRRLTVNGLGHPIAVAIVDNRYPVAGCGQMVFEIVVVALAVRAFSLDQRYEYF